MNIGIRLHDTRPGTLRERLGFAAAQGFSCVQLAMGKAVPGFRMDDAPALLTADLAAEVREELDRARLECAVLGCYLTLAQSGEEEAAHTREFYRAHLRFAAEIGAGCVGTETPASGSEGRDCRTEEHYRLFLDRVRNKTHIIYILDRQVLIKNSSKPVVLIISRTAALIPVILNLSLSSNDLYIISNTRSPADDT